MWMYKFINRHRPFSYSQIRKCMSTQPELVRKKPSHKPVMVQEVLNYMKPMDKKLIVDMTFGAGGHSQSLLNEGKNLKIIALDRDPVSHERALQLSKIYPDRIIPLLGKFSELPGLLGSINIHQYSIDGFLFDFGCSSMQFDTANRGFSVSKDGPLDMRMDGDRIPDQITAADVISRASEEDLAKIFKVYGEEKQYRKIARAIVESRYMFRNLTTTSELADLVDSVCEDEERVDKLNRKAHNATKIFQALRIFVNDELNEINQGIHIASKYLKLGGILVTLSFHSLEDTIIKRHIHGNMTDNVANALPLKYCNPSILHEKIEATSMIATCWRSLTKHVVVPSLLEVDNNPRSRSARLRAAIKI